MSVFSGKQHIAGKRVHIYDCTGRIVTDLQHQHEHIHVSDCVGGLKKTHNRRQFQLEIKK